jgi:hypothetical protein
VKITHAFMEECNRCLQKEFQPGALFSPLEDFLTLYHQEVFDEISKHHQSDML